MNQQDKMNQQVIDALRQTVASTYALIGQLHLCHWNVRGNSFFSLHDAFQAQYTELFTAVDEIAERIRAIGDAIVRIVTPTRALSVAPALREVGYYVTKATAEGLDGPVNVNFSRANAKRPRINRNGEYLFKRPEPSYEIALDLFRKTN